MKKVYVIIILYQCLNDRLSLSSFPLIDIAKIGIKKYPARMKKRVGKELGNKRKNWGKNWGKLPLPVDTQEAFCNIYTPDRLRRIPVLECPIGEVAKDITIRFLDRRYLRKVR